MLIVDVYVKDLLIIGTIIEAIHEFKRRMKEKFEMSDLGKLALSWYRGVSETGLYYLKQTAYARKLLERLGLVIVMQSSIQRRHKII